MARSINQLTDRSIKAKKARGYYGDGNGLYLQVSPSGSRSWVFRYKSDGKAREMGLGSYPSTSLADAREKTLEARQLRDKDRDPLEVRAAQAAEKRLEAAGRVTFRECAEQFIATNTPGWRNAKHAQQWSSTLEVYAYPVLGDLPVAAINTALVMKVLEPIWTTKTETASRLRGRIESVLGAAKSRGYRTGENPAVWRGHLKNMLPNPSKVARTRHHTALPYKELPALMARLRTREGAAARALEFAILTASRTGEVIGATFAEMDLAGEVWSIPGERMKSGQPHRVPLCGRALDIVRDMAAYRINSYVFPGRSSGEPLGDTILLDVLRVLHGAVTVHGFRSSFKDWASDTTNFPDHVSEAALAHTSADKVRGAYARSDLFEKRRRLMVGWANHCQPPRVTPRRARAKVAA